MIAILAEKPSITLAIIENHLDKLPNEDIYFIHTYGIMPFVFDLPKKVKYKEYNYIANSACILNKPFKLAFGDNMEFKMSKYGLQTRSI